MAAQDSVRRLRARRSLASMGKGDGDFMATMPAHGVTCLPDTLKP